MRATINYAAGNNGSGRQASDRGSNGGASGAASRSSSLAGAADVSQRHLSFLEIGRTSPSREMVLRLAAALDLPLRQQNALLLAAGYAPVWRESALEAPALAVVNQALDYMLAQQEPYPAFVVDRRWNLLRANGGGQRFVGFLTDTPPSAPDPAAAHQSRRRARCARTRCAR